MLHSSIAPSPRQSLDSGHAVSVSRTGSAPASRPDHETSRNSIRRALAPIIEPINEALRGFEPFRQQSELWFTKDLLPEGDLNRVRDEALARYKSLPSFQQFAKWVPLLQNASTKPATERQTLVLLGLMLDAMPNVRVGNADAYLDGLAFLIEDDCGAFSPYIIAQCIRWVWKELRTAPTPGEFLKMCQRERHTLVVSSNLAEHLWQLQVNARWILEDCNDPVISDDDTADNRSF